MPDSFTHRFNFRVGDTFIRGECEFNTDQKASVWIKESSNPLPTSLLKSFYEHIESCKNIYEEHGGTTDKFELVVKKLE